MAIAGVDCWLTHVNQMQTLLDVLNIIPRKRGSGKKITSIIRSKFDRYWLDCINETKTNDDQFDHNKLRTYNSSFSREPYLDLVRNWNQRSNLSRLRMGSHNLGVERGSWTRPVTPLDQRLCVYCSPEATIIEANQSPMATCTPSQPPTPPLTHFSDTDQHFLTLCNRFTKERNVAYAEMSSLVPHFPNLSAEHKFKTLLCPTTPQCAKLTSKFIKLMFERRETIDKGNSN